MRTRLPAWIWKPGSKRRGLVRSGGWVGRSMIAAALVGAILLISGQGVLASSTSKSPESEREGDRRGGSGGGDDGERERLNPLEMEVVDILRHIAERGTTHFNNPLRIEELETEVRQATDARQRVGLAFHLGRELLGLGRSEEALRVFLDIRSFLSQPGQEVHPDLLRQLGEQLAVTYLRLAEQENCVAHHNAASCILPIADEGRHRIERGARGALRELEALMESSPNLAIRWLLNLAAMTLGEYPEKVREAWRIPPETFASEYDLPRFANLAGQAGVDHFGTSGGVVLEDLDGDGLLDLVISAWGVDEQLRYFRNRGDGTFEDQTRAAGLLGQLGGLNLIHADYDNSGRADILVLRGAWLAEEGLHPNSLLRNEGPGPDGVVTFRDVTREAGLLSFFPTQTAAWADYDRDGWLDLFIGNESLPGLESPSHLYRNNGDGTFTNVTAQSGLDVKGFVKAAVWGDVNRNGWPDLYLSLFGESNKLFLNQGPGPDGTWRFEDVSAEAGVEEPLMSFPAWFWDYDNDGWLDLLVAPYSGLFGDSLEAVVADALGEPSSLEHGRLYRNLGPQDDGGVAFADVTREVGLDRALLAMGANFGDLDNDGWLDAYFGTGEPDLKTLIPNRMFRNDAGKRFQDVTSSGGFGHLQKGHGIAFGDINNDGQQDVYAVMGGAYAGDAYQNALFVNPGNDNAWVTLVLEGVASNRGAVGALVQVVATGPDGERSIWRTVGSGGSFGSSSLRLEIGLGGSTGIDRVEVHWPNAEATHQVFRGLEPRAFYRLREGAEEPERLERRRFHLVPKEGREEHQDHEPHH